MNTTEQEWAEKEFGGVALGDKRLNKRVVKVAAALSSTPESSINEAFKDWAATQASYRLFQNERVAPEKILEPHKKRTVERMRGDEVVLALQDTTFLNYDGHRKTKDLGPIGSSHNHNHQGLAAHSVLCVSGGAGVPLGILHCKIKARKEYKGITKGECAKIPFEEKESSRWVDALREIDALAPKGCRIITIGDRESDIYEFFHEAELLNREFVVRANHDRALTDQGENLNDFIASQAIVGTKEITIPKTEKRAKRTVLLALRCAEIKIRKPKYRKAPKGSLSSLYAILATEIDPKEEPIRWLLLSNIPVNTFEDAVEKIEWYQKRWRIEELHKILKSGCNIESCRLQTAKRLINYLTLMWVVGWRIFRLTHLSRTNPKAPATEILTKMEIHTLIAMEQGVLSLPEKPLTVLEATLLIGQLGGFLRRKHDRHPGPKNIWRGWARLQDAALLGAVVFQNKTCV